ncbi:MAG: DUF721 domain-containing protein [Tannerella sp.]|jgi:predicted nucleic acid-binding Zn ribbon protein|nr:DUF721 domain-containing protein [Tannerella sp.]
MKRTNAQSISELLQDFYKENPALRQKILEIRIQRAWGEMLGPMIMQSTRDIYVKNGVLYVFLKSSVLRSELILNKERILKSLNEYAEANVIQDIVIR